MLKNQYLVLYTMTPTKRKIQTITPCAWVPSAAKGKAKLGSSHTNRCANPNRAFKIQFSIP
jgi:hypothetical protein